MEKYYELTYTTSKNLSPEEVNSLLEKIMSYFPNAIKKGPGYDFSTLEFYAEPEMIEGLEKNLKSESQIKKYMIVKKETAKAIKTRIRKPFLQITTPSPEQKVEKAELNKIDEKLKEIFGE